MRMRNSMSYCETSKWLNCDLAKVEERKYAIDIHSRALRASRTYGTGGAGGGGADKARLDKQRMNKRPTMVRDRRNSQSYLVTYPTAAAIVVFTTAP